MKRFNSQFVSIQMLIYGTMLLGLQIVSIVIRLIVGESVDAFPEPVIPAFKVLSTLLSYLPGITGFLGLVIGITRLHSNIQSCDKIVYCVLMFFSEAFLVYFLAQIASKIMNADLYSKSQVLYFVCYYALRLINLAIPFLGSAAGALGGVIAASLGRTYIRFATSAITFYDPQMVGLTLYYAVNELELTLCASLILFLALRKGVSFKYILFSIVLGLLNGRLLTTISSYTLDPLILQNMAPTYVPYLLPYIDNPIAIIGFNAVFIICVLAIAVDFYLIIRSVVLHKKPVIEKRSSKELLTPDEATVQPIVRFCRRCGNELAEGSRFCNHCGTEIEI